MSNTWVRIRNSAPLLAVALLLLATPGRSQGDGATMFKSKCAACHGADGKADTTMGKALKIRDLGSQPVQSQPDAQLTENRNQRKEQDATIRRKAQQRASHGVGGVCQGAC